MLVQEELNAQREKLEELEKRIQRLEHPFVRVDIGQEIPEEAIKSLKEKFERFSMEGITVVESLNPGYKLAKDFNEQDIAFLTSEIARLKRGDFTAEELQNLCHNLPEEKKEEFFKGCTNYQNKLFKCNAVDEEMERCIRHITGYRRISDLEQSDIIVRIRAEAAKLRG